MLTTLDKVLAENKPVSGETMRDTLFKIGKFQGLIPLEFKSNTATVPLDINVMQGRQGRDAEADEVDRGVVPVAFSSRPPLWRPSTSSLHTAIRLE